jgi:hypothetical protein
MNNFLNIAETGVPILRRRNLRGICLYLGETQKHCASTIRYPLPKIPNMYPSSCGYAHFGGDDILNVRYVNYRLDDGGAITSVTQKAIW